MYFQAKSIIQFFLHKTTLSSLTLSPSYSWMTQLMFLSKKALSNFDSAICTIQHFCSILGLVNELNSDYLPLMFNIFTSSCLTNNQFFSSSKRIGQYKLNSDIDLADISQLNITDAINHLLTSFEQYRTKNVAFSPELEKLIAQRNARRFGRVSGSLVRKLGRKKSIH